MVGHLTNNKTLEMQSWSKLCMLVHIALQIIAKEIIVLLIWIRNLKLKIPLYIYLTYVLIYLPLVPHIYVGKSGQYWFR